MNSLRDVVARPSSQRGTVLMAVVGVVFIACVYGNPCAQRKIFLLSKREYPQGVGVGIMALPFVPLSKRDSYNDRVGIGLCLVEVYCGIQ